MSKKYLTQKQAMDKALREVYDKEMTQKPPENGIEPTKMPTFEEWKAQHIKSIHSFGIS